MREIEIKARVADKPALLAKLRMRGVALSEPVRQHDVVYGQLSPDGKTWGGNWLRIRTENDTRVIFTFKKSVVGQLDSIEHELEVSNAEELAAIVAQLGFTLYSDLTKVRAKGKFGDIEVCIDTVPGLGDFMEAELLLGHDADHDHAEVRLWRLLTALGIEKAAAVHDGYDVMMRRKDAMPR